MSESITFNEDCMDGLRRYPDGFFDLAVVDPPYGGGLADDGGCKGWFTKYHQNEEAEHRNLRGRFDRYNNPAPDSSKSVHVERERERAERRTGV